MATEFCTSVMDGNAVGLGSLAGGVMGLGGSGILAGGGAGLTTSPGILGSSGVGSSGLVSGLPASVLDSLGNNGMYSSGRSASVDRGHRMGSRMDDRRGRMESRMSGGGDMYGSSGQGQDMGRVPYDHDRGRPVSIDYDRGDRGSSDPYARSDTCSIFVKNVSCYLLSRYSRMHILGYSFC